MSSPIYAIRNRRPIEIKPAIQHNTYYVMNCSGFPMYPSITAIRCFVAVSENASFRRASEILHLSQPSVSAHIRSLEQQFGVPLLNRTTRSVRLTPAGARFLARAKSVLFELSAVVEDVKDVTEFRRGRVIVACVPTIASSSLPEVIARFMKSYPGIQVQILDDISETLYHQVLEHQADFGIGPAPASKWALSFSPLVRDHFIAVFPRGHKLANRKTIRLSELTKLPFLTLPRPTNVRILIDQAAFSNGIELTPAYEVGHHYTLGAMVAAGLGFTALPSMSLSLLGQMGLAGVKIVNPQVYRTIGIIRRADEKSTPAAEAFVSVLSENIGIHVARTFRQSARHGAAPSLSQARQSRTNSTRRLR
jgi:LysR family carnitine catabolism transcriptional activator